MALAEILDGLKTRKQERATGFAELVAKAATGGRLLLADTEKVLARCGKSAEDFAAAVELAKERIGLRRTINAAAELEKLRPGITKEIANADLELTKARETHERTVAPLIARLDAITAAARTAKDAARKLRATAPADLKNNAEKIAHSLRKLHAQRAELQERSELTKTAERERLEADIRTDGQKWLDRATVHQRSGEAALAELPEVERAITEAEQSAKDIAARILQA